MAIFNGASSEVTSISEIIQKTSLHVDFPKYRVMTGDSFIVTGHTHQYLLCTSYFSFHIIPSEKITDDTTVSPHADDALSSHSSFFQNYIQWYLIWIIAAFARYSLSLSLSLTHTWHWRPRTMVTVGVWSHQPGFLRNGFLSWQIGNIKNLLKS